MKETNVEGQDYTEFKEYLLEEIEPDFLAFLQSLSYSPTSVNDHHLLLNRIRKFMRLKEILMYSRKIGNEYLAFYLSNHLNEDGEPRPGLRGERSKLNRLNDFIDSKYQRRHNYNPCLQLSEAYEKLLLEYLDQCRKSKLNKEGTIVAKRATVRSFLLFLSERKINRIDKIQAYHIVDWSEEMVDKSHFTYLRDFFRYCFGKGYIATDFSYVVPKYSPPVRIPDVYSIEEIKLLESSIDKHSDIGKRDHAMMLLLTRLAYRPSDVANLKFENIDFENNRISFSQVKTEGAKTSELMPEIKTALKIYINEARPQSDSPYIFLSVLAPYTKMDSSSVYNRVSSYFQLASIETGGKHIGPRSLRSSASSSMINDSMPYAAVKDVLGHFSKDAIKHYAALDREHLRMCALKPAAATGNFLKLLRKEVSACQN